MNGAQASSAIDGKKDASLDDDIHVVCLLLLLSESHGGELLLH